MFCELGYRTLETQSIKQKRVESTVFQIFGIAIKRYNHALTFPVRIIQILRLKELAIVPIANGICLLNDDFGISTISTVLLKDLVETLQEVAVDSQIAKHFSTFLTELGSVGSKLLVPHLSKLAEDLLNVEVSRASSVIQNYHPPQWTHYVVFSHMLYGFVFFS